MDKEFELEMLKAVIAFATLAIKTLVLVNGAAVIALLTFLGNIWDKNGSAAIVAAAGESLKFFIYGLVAGLVTTALAYMSQLLFTELPSGSQLRRWSGEAFRIAGVITAAASIVYFALGATHAHKAMLIPPPPAAVQAK